MDQYTTPPNTPKRNFNVVTTSPTEESTHSEYETVGLTSTSTIPPKRFGRGTLKKMVLSHILLVVLLSLGITLNTIPNTSSISWWEDTVKHQQTDRAVDYWTSTELIVYNHVNEINARRQCPYNREHVLKSIDIDDTEMEHFFENVLSSVGESPAKPHPVTLINIYQRCEKLVKEELADDCYVYHPNHG